MPLLCLLTKLGVPAIRMIRVESVRGNQHVMTKANDFLPRPARWPYRADPPMRYWGNYRLYQARGGLVHLEEDIRGIVADESSYGDISRFYFFVLHLTS